MATGAVTDVHPEFAFRLPEWEHVYDTYAGSRIVKSKGVAYLPALQSMVQDGMNTPEAPGSKDYEDYKVRAHFYDLVREAVEAMLGILHMRPAVIKVPKRMEPMLNNITIQGESAQMLLRRINEAQLVASRCGLLCDVPDDKGPNVLPYISFYDTRRIINWDAGRIDEGMNDLEFVVLNESGIQRRGFQWVTENKYRVLARVGASIAGGIDNRPLPNDPFGFAVLVNNTSIPQIDDFKVAELAGKPMTKIPFTFIGANDLLPEPNRLPLLGLSELAIAIYQADADYRQTLHMQGQNTLVVIGQNGDDEDQVLRVGAKGMIGLRIGGDAKYIGVSAAGLGEMRQAIQRDKDLAGTFGIQFLSADAAAESGEALRTRIAARTTTLSSIAMCGGKGLESALRDCAVWMGEDPALVSVSPNTDFADANVQGAALLAFMQAKQLGLPLSLKSLHRMMLANDMTDMDYEAETMQIDLEATESLLGLMVHGAFMGGTDENFQDDPDDPRTDDGGGGGGIAPIPKIAAKNVPITPHTRGSPNPLKLKVGKKGASAKK